MRRSAPVLSALALACGAPAPGGTDTDAPATTDAATTGATTDATTGEPLPAGCDVLLRGGEDDLQSGLAAAPAGATVCLAGTFALAAPVTLPAPPDGLTLRGVDPPAVLDFQRTGGLEISGATGLRIEDLEIRDTQGPGLTIAGGSDVAVLRVRVGWSTPASPDNGLFGLRFEATTGVRVDDCDVSGAADAAIFALDAKDVRFRGNRVSGSVNGLQVENTEDAEIVGNEATGNALGVFVVDLPTAPSNRGGVLVHGNTLRDNNGPNFAPAGSLASAVPPGLGVMILATDTVEVRDNTITGNGSAAALVVSFETVALLSPPPGEPDPGYDAWPETIDIHDNTMTGNGEAPAALFVDVFAMDPMAEIAWDGVADAAKDNADGHLNLCIRANGDADFVDLDALNLGADKSFDLAPHDCGHPPVPPRP